MRTPVLLAVLTGSVLVLAGCAGAPADDAAPAPEAPKEAAPASSSKGFTIDHITSCDQVATIVAPYIAELEPRDDNAVDEWGVSCTWETAEGETDFANVRSVTVQMVPQEEGTPAPDPSLVLKMDGGALIEDAWVTENKGVAYSLSMGTAVAGVTTSTVWFPEVETNVSGGQWAEYPALDGPAALKVVKALLGS